MRILVVEDNAVIASVTRRVLAGLGYDEIARVESGEEALEFAEVASFDIFLVDWMLPGMSGIEVVRRLRQSENNGSATIIMTTAKGTTKDVMQAVEAGIDDYIVKPITADVLEAKLAAFSSKRGEDESQDALDAPAEASQDAAGPPPEAPPHDADTAGEADEAVDPDASGP